MSNTTNETLKKRHQVEESFHDKWAEEMDLSEILVRESFEASTAVENRFALSKLGQLKNKRVLDLGCGAGEAAVYFALQGAQVVAADISQQMLNVAHRLAQKHGVSIETKKLVAEQMPFDDSSFDVVFGNGVLHHVDVQPALKEIHRILKPGGKAAFIEPLPYNPAIEVYRFLASEVRTPTEKPFSFKNFPFLEKLYRKVEHKEFGFMTLLIFFHFFFIQWANPSKVRYWKKLITEASRHGALFDRLQRLDDTILGTFPFLGRLCWNTVIILEK